MSGSRNKWLRKHRPWLDKCKRKHDVYNKRKRYDKYIKSPEWRAVRRMALEHFRYKCFLCCSGLDLEVHHLNYGTFGCESIEDVIVLCANCHAAEHAKKSGRIRKHIHWTPNKA